MAKTATQWEVKDRLYKLAKNKKPLIFTIPTARSSTKTEG
jgi:hypothetical protein